MGRVAVRLPNWLGDVVMSTPFLYKLRSTVREHLVLVGKEKFRGILSEDFFDTFVPLSGMWKTSKVLRDMGVELFFVLPNSFGSAVLSLLSGARERVGYNTEGRGFLLTHPVSVSKVRLDMPRYYLNLLAHYFGTDISPFPGLFVRASEKNSEELYRLKPGSYAVFVPGASFGPSKMWPWENFKRLAELVVSYFGVDVVVAPGPGEEELAVRISKGLRRVFPFVSPVPTLDELLVLIKDAIFIVSNDTGPRHIGEALSTPTVVLMGPTDPLYTNYPSRFTLVIRGYASCSPCHKKVCPRNIECMRSIEPLEVFRALRSVLLDTGFRFA